MEELTEADFLTLSALEERWQAEQQEVRAYIGALSDEGLNGNNRACAQTEFAAN